MSTMLIHVIYGKLICLRLKHLVTKADVREVMCAYQRLDDEPCCGNNRLLQQFFATSGVLNTWLFLIAVLYLIFIPVTKLLPMPFMLAPMLFLQERM